MSMEKMIPQHGKRYVASGMEASKTGRSGFGRVMKEVDREKWVTISKIAVPLKVSAAMAAEDVGVCVVTGVPRSDPV